MPCQIVGAVRNPLDQKVDPTFGVQPIERTVDRLAVSIVSATAHDHPHSDTSIPDQLTGRRRSAIPEPDEFDLLRVAYFGEDGRRQAPCL